MKVLTKFVYFKDWQSYKLYTKFCSPTNAVRFQYEHGWFKIIWKNNTKPKIFIHSFSILSDDMSKASSKTMPPYSAMQSLLLSLRSSSSFLRLLPRLLATSISPFIFPSVTCFRMQFLRKMWPIQLAFLFLISCRIFLCSLTLSNTSSFLTWSVQLIFSILLSKSAKYYHKCKQVFM